MTHNPFRLTARKPVAIGTGLLALDVVLNGKSTSPSLWAGGTCGNVLAILSFLGWHAYPVARLNGDKASIYIREDLQQWGVRLDYSRLSPPCPTPIVVQRIFQSAAGIPSHRFSWTCPSCGSWLPTYRAVTASAVQEVIEQMRRPKVVFIDRVSRGAITLAKVHAAQGALIALEPSCTQDRGLFHEALQLTHILKYSNERTRQIAELIGASAVPLEIETLGSEGLRYRSRLKNSRTRNWQRLGAFEPLRLKDTSGAGDWCTAGIIHRLGQNGSAGFNRITPKQLNDALCFGQALAAWNCGYEGARGGMYSTDKRALQKQIQMIIAGKPATISHPEAPSRTVKRVFESLCSGCESQK